MAVMDDHNVRIGLPGVRIAARAIGLTVDAFDPSVVPLSSATDVWVQLDLIERLASGAKHLGRLSCTSTKQMQRAIDNSKALPALGEVEAAVRFGELSNVQVEIIVPAAAADPTSQRHLLGLAKTTNVSELRAACLRTKVKADRDPDATHDRIHKERHGRTFTDAEGAWNLHGRGTAAEGARFETVLHQIVGAAVSRGPRRGRCVVETEVCERSVLTDAGRDRSQRPVGEEETHEARDDPLCGHDHDLKTNDGWSLVAGKGRRAFVSPKDPRHPRNRPPP